MKSKSIKRLLIFLIAFISIAMLINDLGIARLNLYYNTSSNQNHSQWKNKKSKSQTGGGENKLAFPTMSVVVKYKSKTIGDVDSAEPIIVDLTDKDLDLPWLPFYKHADYSFDVTVKKVAKVENERSTARLNINGNIKVSGEYTFIGICSKKQIEGIISKKVMDDIYKEVKKNLPE